MLQARRRASLQVIEQRQFARMIKAIQQRRDPSMEEEETP
jgi:hypothetical protein